MISKRQKQRRESVDARDPVLCNPPVCEVCATCNTCDSYPWDTAADYTFLRPQRGGWRRRVRDYTHTHTQIHQWFSLVHTLRRSHPLRICRYSTRTDRSYDGRILQCAQYGFRSGISAEDATIGDRCYRGCQGILRMHDNEVHTLRFERSC